MAGILHCSVDAILLGGVEAIGFRRHITVAQMREVMDAISRIGMLLGHDHFVYCTMVDALNARMNTDIESAFIDHHLLEVFIVELLMACVESGDYVNPKDVRAHLHDTEARRALLDMLRDKGIR